MAVDVGGSNFGPVSQTHDISHDAGDGVNWDVDSRERIWRFSHVRVVVTEKIVPSGPAACTQFGSV